MKHFKSIHKGIVLNLKVWQEAIVLIELSSYDFQFTVLKGSILIILKQRKLKIMNVYYWRTL